MITSSLSIRTLVYVVNCIKPSDTRNTMQPIVNLGFPTIAKSSTAKFEPLINAECLESTPADKPVVPQMKADLPQAIQFLNIRRQNRGRYGQYGHRQHQHDQCKQSGPDK